MSTGGRTTNTMSEMLTNMLRDVSIAKTLPDADLEFLTNLEMTLLAKVREPTDQAAGQIPMGPDQNALPGVPGGAPPVPPVPGGAPPPPMPPMPPGGQSLPGLPGGGMPQIDPAQLQAIMAGAGGGPVPPPPA